MKHNINDFKRGLSDIEEWLKKEMSGIRTGRATINLLDSVMVESYGTKSPINQNATINIEDPKTIRIVPWDKSLIQAIEKSITVADLGISTSVDGEGLRVIFPNLTTETREKLVKQAKGKMEEAKISTRNERNKIMKEIDEDKKDGGLPEDDMKRAKDEVESLIKKSHDAFEDLLKKKEQEILI
ncbi:ribosome recycling factor [Candidatus Nomurabacteria bacterium]|nr:ribosome recycling factor [Candidatus Nomurabacteria bacterium]